MTDTPHFDYPFRLKGSSFAEVEQDTMDDLVACIEAALLTPQGFRDEIPSFGITETTFQTQPIRSQQMMDEIVQHEPRANLLMDQEPNKFNQMIADVAMKVTAREEDTVD